MAGGLPDDRVLRVQGLAASQLFDPKDPLTPANRRISIIVMNREAEDRFFRTEPDLERAAPPDAQPWRPRRESRPAGSSLKVGAGHR
jgi:chemotaxis protein MotB